MRLLGAKTSKMLDASKFDKDDKDDKDDIPSIEEKVSD
jgi:hypothetical protein